MDDRMSDPGELDAREAALLERFADLQGPSFEAEERMLAAIEAAIEAEATQTEASEHSPGAALHRVEDGSRTWTSVAIAVTAFAAGALLTCGLQGEALRALEQGRAPSVSPMLADDDVESRELSAPTERGACEPTIIEKKIYVPVPTEAAEAPEAAGVHSDPTDEDGEPADPDPHEDPTGASPVFGAVQDRHESGAAAKTPSSSAAIASATWVPSRTGTTSSSSRGGPTSSRRPARGAGVGGASSGWSPTSASPSAGGAGGSAAPGTPSGSQTSPGPSQPTPGDGEPPRPQPDPPSTDPEPLPPGPDEPPNPQPEPPSPDEPPGPDEPPSPDEPHPEDELPEDEWFEDCDLELETCLEHSMLVCETAPEICGDISDGCLQQHDACLFQDSEPYPNDWECEEFLGGCYDAADMVCAEDPAHCEEFYLGCDAEFETCMAQIPPPPIEIPPEDDEPPLED